MTYDPGERRKTPLARTLAARITRSGPITVQAYMAACLGDSEHGYYRTQEAVGRDGDFITAPEISQVFGELIGLWAAVVWQQMGQPHPFNLVELGPGRGTLMVDALRASRRIPGFHHALRLWLVEPNAALRSVQRAAIATTETAPNWTEHFDVVPPGPSIVIANEMLDTAPIGQYLPARHGWIERGIRLDGAGNLRFCALHTKPRHFFAGLTSTDAKVTVFERRDDRALAYGLSRLCADGPVAGLFIDYGQDYPGLIDTLQAVRRHAFEHPLASPGEADLTAQVDFSQFRRALTGWGFTCAPLQTQAEFLGALGIVERASRLMSANPNRALEIETAVARLLAPGGMGTRFKVLGASHGLNSPLPTFAT